MRSNGKQLIDLSHTNEYGLMTYKGLPSFKFFAVPVKVKGMGTFPVRAFAIV